MAGVMSGPAFQGQIPDGARIVDGAAGISLRDWFAGMFASTIPLDIADRIAAPNMVCHDELNEDRDGDEFIVPRAELARRMAVASYYLADAMLKARELKAHGS